MKVAEFLQVVEETPRFVPVFRVIRVPDWADTLPPSWPAIEVGTEVYVWARSGVSLWEIGRGGPSGSLDIRPNHLKFVEYRRTEV